MENTFTPRIGERLRTLRGNQSQAKMAEQFGVKQVTYSTWENNTRSPDITTVCNIAITFGVTTDWLLGLQTDSQQQEGRRSIPPRLTDRLDEIKINAERTTASINALQNAIDKLKKTI